MLRILSWNLKNYKQPKSNFYERYIQSKNILLEVNTNLILIFSSRTKLLQELKVFLKFCMFLEFSAVPYKIRRKICKYLKI